MIDPRRAACMTFLLIVVFFLLVVTGCPRSSEQSVPTSAVPAASVQLPTITAYVNVSSGCQKPTVDALKEIATAFDGRLAIEIIDFGDDAAGTRRWKEAGLDCMRILFEDRHLVAWEQDGEIKVVDFSMPPGFNWTLADLDNAIAAFAEGRIREPTPEEKSKVQQLTPTQIATSAQSTTTDDGVEVGQLIIGGTLALEITRSLGDLTPLQRAAAAAKAVAKWTGKAYNPSDLSITKSSRGLQIVAGPITIITVTQDDADAAQTNVQALAAEWRNDIRSSVTSAAGKGHLPARDD
jgi:hypothetical protein